MAAASFPVRWALVGTISTLLCFSLTASASAQDWSSCESDLDGLRRRAGDASSQASSANDYFGRVKSAQEELQQCRRFPEMYDFFKDGCAGKRNEYSAALSAYRTQLGNLQSSLEDVDSKIRATNSSCTSELVATLGPPPSVPDAVKNKQMCSVFLRYKRSLPVSALVGMCTKQMPESECLVCLGDAK